MSSFLHPKSSLDFAIDRQDPPSPARDAESLNPRKNVHSERESSITSFTRSESAKFESFRSALLALCITAFLISIYTYDPSHSRPASSQDIFSSVCFAIVSNLTHRHLSINNNSDFSNHCPPPTRRAPAFFVSTSRTFS